MATIRKRNGKYQVQVRRKGFPHVSRSFKLKSDAEEWYRLLEHRADRGELPSTSKDLSTKFLSELIQRYRDEISIRKLSHNTEIYILNAFLKSSIAGLSLSEINTSHFRAYREKRLLSVKAGTVNRELSIIKHALDISIKEWGIKLKDNPLNNLPKLPVKNSRSRRLDKGELEILIKASKNDNLVSVIFFALETAMRRGEILNMRWCDVDFKNSVLFIPVTKNGYSRTIPLTPQALDVLKQRSATERDQKNETIFPFTGNAIRLAWERLTKKAKIKNLHFHDLRHEAISSFFERGLSVPEVALISGHRDYRMLLRYTHIKPEEIAKKLS